MRTPRITIPTIKVLTALQAAPKDGLSGYQIMQSSGLASGTLYPILMRMQKYGWVTSYCEKVDPHDAGRPRRRYYQLTGVGQTVASGVKRELESALVPLGARLKGVPTWTK
jgi:DNA-binding PadR family transcriptional regulator